MCKPGRPEVTKQQSLESDALHLLWSSLIVIEPELEVDEVAGRRKVIRIIETPVNALQ